MKGPEGDREAPYGGVGALAGPILLGLALRAALAGFTNTPSVDGAAFLLPLADSLLEGDLGDWRWGTFPPLYPAVVAAICALIGHLVLAGQVVSVVAGTLTIVPGTLLARRLLGDRDARRAAWILAALPLACHYSARPQTEALYALFFCWGVVGFVRLVKRPCGGAALLLGTMAGLAAATRPEGAGLVVAGVVAILAARPAADGTGRGRAAAALLIPFLILSLPVVLLTHRVTSRWTLSPKAGYIFQRNLHPDPDEYYFRLTPDRERLLFETYILEPDRAPRFDPLSVPPGELVSTYATSLGRLMIGLPKSFDPPLIILALMGVLLRRRPRWSRPGRAGVILFVAYVIALALFSSERRFWVPLLPMLVLLSARGIGRVPPRWQRTVTIVTVLLLLPHIGGPAADQGFAWGDSAERRLARLIPPGGEERILSEDGRVAVFARADHIFLPKAPAEDVLHFAKVRGSRYLAADPLRLESRRPGLLEGMGDHLRVLGVETGRGKCIILYHIQ